MANTWTRQARQLASLPDPRPGWLVDVFNFCLAPAKTSPLSTYVALSYVWGRTRTLQTLLSTIDGFQERNAFLVEENASQIPSTIKDAMYVTKLLEELRNFPFIPQHAVSASAQMPFSFKDKTSAQDYVSFRSLRTYRITNSIQEISMG
jgi:hypothetical protein